MFRKALSVALLVAVAAAQYSGSARYHQQAPSMKTFGQRLPATFDYRNEDFQAPQTHIEESLQVEYETPVEQVQPEQIEFDQVESPQPAAELEGYMTYEEFQAPDANLASGIAPSEEEIFEQPAAALQYEAPESAPVAEEEHFEEEAASALPAPAAYEEEIFALEPAHEAVEEEIAYEAPAPVALPVPTKAPAKHAAPAKPKQTHAAPAMTQAPKSALKTYNAPVAAPKPVKQGKSYRPVAGAPTLNAIPASTPKHTYAPKPMTTPERRPTYGAPAQKANTAAAPAVHPTHAAPATSFTKSAAYSNPVHTAPATIPMTVAQAAPAMKPVYGKPSKAHLISKPAHSTPAPAPTLAKTTYSKPTAQENPAFMLVTAPLAKPTYSAPRPAPIPTPLAKPITSNGLSSPTATYVRPVMTSRPKPVAVPKPTYAGSPALAPVMAPALAAAPARTQSYGSANNARY